MKLNAWAQSLERYQAVSPASLKTPVLTSPPANRPSPGGWVAAEAQVGCTHLPCPQSHNPGLHHLPSPPGRAPGPPAGFLGSHWEAWGEDGSGCIARSLLRPRAPGIRPALGPCPSELLGPAPSEARCQSVTCKTRRLPGSPLWPACTGTADWEAGGCWSGSCPPAHGWTWHSGQRIAETGGGQGRGRHRAHTGTPLDTSPRLHRVRGNTIINCGP